MRKRYLVIGLIFLLVFSSVFPISISCNIKNPDIIEQTYSDFLDNRYFYNAYNHSINVRNYKYDRPIENKLKNNKENIYYSTETSEYKCLNTFENSNTIYVPDDYPTIQSAIDNATAGDTIIVRNGTYVENIIVDKPLVIKSEYGYSNCCIQEKSSSLNIITINSDFVSIIGFSIIGSNNGQHAGIAHYHVNNTSIVGNRFAKIYFCTQAQYSNNNSFYDNLIGSAWEFESWGIYLEYSNNNTIHNNTITDLNYYAVAINLGNSHNNIVTNNTLTWVSYCIGLVSSTNNLIMNNYMISDLWGQMYIENSYYNQIINNTFPDAETDGIYLLKSENNTISNNNFPNSGIFVYDSYNNTIEDNTVNNRALIYLEDKSDITVNEEAGQVVLVNCNNIKISDQDLSHTIVGLELFKTNNSMFSNCRISSPNWETIYAIYSNYNHIFNCTLEDGWQDIGFYNCNGNIIDSNYIVSSHWETMIIENSHFNTLINNKVADDNFLGIYLYSSNYNDICFNEIFNLSEYTYDDAIELHNSKYNNISHNNFHDLVRGIGLYDLSDYNTIKRNDLSITKSYCGLNSSFRIYTSYNNSVVENNFLAGPVGVMSEKKSTKTIWSRNYWYKSLTHPKIIKEYIKINIIITKFYFKWINVDWHPAKEPYDIGL